MFTNLPSTTVTSGGTTAPASGTQETWTVASSSSFPAASSGASPPTQFHVADVAANSEIIAVTNVSGNAWTVTRGAESTTPVAHAAGFTVFQVVTAGTLGGMLQSVSNLSDITSASSARTNLGLGSAATISTPVSVANGGTGQVTQQAAMDALAGATTSGDYLRGNGTHVVMSALLAADVPQLADYAPTGLTGATAASRYVGGTASGAPVSGTFATGDFVIDQQGTLSVCTAGGTPGTWVTGVLWNVDAQSNNGVQRVRSSTGNFLSNAAFGSWSAGTSTAPDAWTAANGATIAQSSTTTIGSFSAQVTFDASGNGEFYQPVSTSTLVNYTFTCYVQRTSGTGAARLVAQRADSPFTEFASVNLSTTAGWQLALLTVQPPAGTQMRFSIKAGSAATSVWLVSECMFQESQAVATTFQYAAIDDTNAQDIYNTKTFHLGLIAYGNLDVAVAGQGLKVAEGSNAKQGTLTLNGTTAVVVSNTSVTANSRIFLTIQAGSGTVGSPYVSARSANTSFSVKSTAVGDTSTCAYEIFEPG